MNNYCSTCLGYIASDPCDGCDGTEENHIYYEPDFVKKSTKPRYLEAEKLKRQMGLMPMDWNTRDEMWMRESDIACYIDACSEADVVKVVRCRECKFSEEVNPGLYICHNEDIKIVGTFVDPDWYCADGKRRKDNGKIH